MAIRAPNNTFCNFRAQTLKRRSAANHAANVRRLYSDDVVEVKNKQVPLATVRARVN
jgi:hypothetical protein